VACRRGCCRMQLDGSLVLPSTLHAKLRHGNHPILQWCASNCVVDRDPLATEN
jgi:hypothetical protein